MSVSVNYEESQCEESSVKYQEWAMKKEITSVSVNNEERKNECQCEESSIKYEVWRKK